MSKYYRLKEETFMWDKGAILIQQESSYAYPVSGVWDKFDSDGNTSYNRITTQTLKGNPQMFERVYQLEDTRYGTKADAQAEYVVETETDAETEVKA